MSNGEPVDTEDHLIDLVVGADPEAIADLRARVLLPLASVDESTGERLAATLRSWLLHQGRRDDVAAELHVHPQTVRYRMQQLRGLYGDRLLDPGFVRELVVALPATRVIDAGARPRRGSPPGRRVLQCRHA